MRICPQCGNPFSNEGLVEAAKDMYCDRCRWTGTSDQSIFVDDALAGVDEYKAQLEMLYQGLAQNVAPHIGKLLIEIGMVLAPRGVDKEEDQQRIQFLAKVLQGATRGAIEGMAGVIAKEVSHGRN